MKAAVAALFLLVAAPPVMAAQPVPAATADLADFDFVVAKVRANYAGWDSKTAGARAAELDALTARLRREAARGGPSFRSALGAWIAWFRDGHLQIAWQEAEAAPPHMAGKDDPVGDTLSLSRVDAETLHLRLPSFGPEYAPALKSLVEQNREALTRTPFLIIDVRRNGGGSDFTYEPLRPFFYTRPIYRIGQEMRASPDNAELLGEIPVQLRPIQPSVAQEVADVAQRMRATRARFVSGQDWPFHIVRLDLPPSGPRRVAFLIDDAASAAESLLLEARQSRRAVLMGKRNSAGVIDFGNMLGMDAPSGRFRLSWATSRSLRVPDDPVDPDGIAPDVRIPPDADPVAFAAAWLKRMP